MQELIYPMTSPSLVDIHITIQRTTILHELGTNWVGASFKQNKSPLMKGWIGKWRPLTKSAHRNTLRQGRKCKHYSLLGILIIMKWDIWNLLSILLSSFSLREQRIFKALKGANLEETLGTPHSSDEDKPVSSSLDWTSSPNIIKYWVKPTEKRNEERRSSQP